MKITLHHFRHIQLPSTQPNMEIGGTIHLMAASVAWMAMAAPIEPPTTAHLSARQNPETVTCKNVWGDGERRRLSLQLPETVCTEPWGQCTPKVLTAYTPDNWQAWYPVYGSNMMDVGRL
jgi:hypothetical protein